MTPAQIVVLALQISIGLIVFSVALQAAPGDVTYLLRRPSLLLRSVLAMNLIMPVVAALIAAAFHLKPAVEVALILLAVSPVPPILPKKETKAGANVSYAIGLLFVSAILAMVVAPFSVMLIGRLFGHEVIVPVASIAVVVAKTVLIPLIAGVVVRKLVGERSARIARPLSGIATLVLLAGVVLILATAWRAVIAQLGDGTLIAIVVFTVASLLAGHVLGGPAADDRTVLALSTASRHPGVATTIATAIAAGDKAAAGAVSGAILLCVLVGAVVVAPYVKARKRSQDLVVVPASALES